MDFSNLGRILFSLISSLNNITILSVDFTNSRGFKGINPSKIAEFLIFLY